jgi:hypothetical protein
LLTIDELIEIIELHDATPLTLTELEAIFCAIPWAKSALPELRVSAQRRRRRQLLIAKLLEHIDKLNREQPDAILAKPETLLALILLAEDNAELHGTTLDDVRQALLLLKTIGIIRLADNQGSVSEALLAGDQGYVSETSLAGARQFLAALARLPIEDMKRTASQGGPVPGQGQQRPH